MQAIWDERNARRIEADKDGGHSASERRTAYQRKTRLKCRVGLIVVHGTRGSVLTRHPIHHDNDTGALTASQAAAAVPTVVRAARHRPVRSASTSIGPANRNG